MPSAGATGATVAAAKDRSIGEAIDDVKISTKIKADFMKSGFKSLYAKIDVEVIEGRVMYTGTVETEEDIMNALEIAWKQEGVKEVLNELSKNYKMGIVTTSRRVDFELIIKFEYREFDKIYYQK